jgi:UDP-N-acetylglucosamine:LPS N-acetylglucosamine transferase
LKKKKVALVCSSGGHLTQLLILREFWGSRDRFWVTFDKVDAISQLAGERIYFCRHPTNRNVINLIRNCFLAIRVLRTEKPDLILSTGAAIAIPFFYLAKFFGAKTAYLEVYDRIDSPTLTGKLVYPVADYFYVQWQDQQKFYPKAILVGELL